MKKGKKPLQAIIMGNEQEWKEVLQDKRHVTIRNGIVDYSHGFTMIGNGKFGECAYVDIISVQKCTYLNIKEQDWRDDGYSNPQEMLDDIRSYYPKKNLTFDSIATVIRWANVRGKLTSNSS